MPDINKDKINLIILFVQYDQKKYDYSFEKLKQIVVKEQNINCKFFVIDNSIEQHYTQNISENITLINGDNSEREFSGWQRGIEKLKELNLNYDIVLFINEAFLAYNDSYLVKYFQTAVDRCIKYKAAVGIVDKDEKNRTLSINNFIFTKWLRSNMFFVPKSFIDKLDSMILISNSELNQIIPVDFHNKISSYKDCFTEDNTLNESFKQKIFEWLTILWHTKIVLSEQTWDFFRTKVKAILNEALLTSKIDELGYDIIWYEAKYKIYFKKFIKKLT
jgi:hypothetical protein